MLHQLILSVLFISSIEGKYLLVETENDGVDYSVMDDDSGECNCLTDWVPVCGVNGETMNECAAGCLGFEVECQGECPCKSSKDYQFTHRPCSGIYCFNQF